MHITNSDCYRSFLDNYMKLNKLSMKALESSVSNVISTASISRIVKKDKNGNYTKAFNIGIDSWVELVSKLKLTEEQKTQAILLRTKDSLINTVGENSAPTKLIAESISIIGNDNVKSETLSVDALQVADTYDKFPNKLKNLINQDILKTIEVFKVLDPARGETLTNNYNYLNRVMIKSS